MLVLAQACFLSANMTMVAFASLAGKLLASDPKFATVPVSLVIVATALVTGPLSIVMQRTSRQFCFRLGAASGVVGGLLAAASIPMSSFTLLCMGALCVGVFSASAQYYRFAAAESVPADYAPRAMAYVLLGGIFAALIAPTLSAAMNDYFLPYTFMGVFIFMAMMAGLALIPLGMMQPVAPQQPLEVTATSDDPVRPLSVIMKDLRFIVAVMNSAAGYMMMSFVMTATPLAMEACGFTPLTSSHVIQGHVIAMFLPGLFTGALIMRYGITNVLLLGQACFAAAFLTALSGIQIGQFSAALILLGIGWNFCFVGGSTLLTRIHSEAEKGRVQGVNEVIVFSFTATGSLASGFILDAFGWQVINQITFLLLAIAAMTTIFYVYKNRQQQTVIE